MKLPNDKQIFDEHKNSPSPISLVHYRFDYRRANVRRSVSLAYAAGSDPPPRLAKTAKFDIIKSGFFGGIHTAEVLNYQALTKECLIARLLPNRPPPLQLLRPSKTVQNCFNSPSKTR